MSEVYVGKQINFLTVIDDKRYWGNGDCRIGYYLCKCKCGNEKLIKDHSVQTGRIRDCGCGEYMRTRFLGKTFGFLKVVDAYRERHSGKVNIMLKCRCVCGKEKIYKSSDLICKNITSCGCKTIRKKPIVRKKPEKKHDSRISRIYFNMIRRCYNENDKDYHYYGERGISVCEEWRNSSLAFQNWALQNGYDKNLTIDRIDVNGDYCPENCRWITIKEQERNKRNNVRYDFEGEKLTLTEIAEKKNLNLSTLRSRIRSGMDINTAVYKKVRFRRKNNV